MSEAMQLQEPIFRLVVRFGNGETAHYLVREPIDTRMITAETRYALISSFFLHSPSQLNDITVVNLRDVTFIKTERVTLDQLAGERRKAGIRADSLEERLPKTLSLLKFV